jgi:hypothetical protein
MVWWWWKSVRWREANLATQRTPCIEGPTPTRRCRQLERCSRENPCSGNIAYTLGPACAMLGSLWWCLITYTSLSTTISTELRKLCEHPTILKNCNKPWRPSPRRPQLRAQGPRGRCLSLRRHGEPFWRLNQTQSSRGIRNLERCHGEHGAGSKAHEVSLSSSWLVIDVFCRLSAKTREKIMASVEISLRSLTVSRQRASGILLKKRCTRFGHQLSPRSQMACLTFTTLGALFRAHCGLQAP